MSWRWLSPQNDCGYKKTTRDEAIEDAVGCVIYMQRSLKPPTTIETMEPENIKITWNGLECAGWRVEEMA